MSTASSTLCTLLRHRVTYRFLIVLLCTLGVASSDESIRGLEMVVCTLLSCVD